MFMVAAILFANLSKKQDGLVSDYSVTIKKVFCTKYTKEIAHI